MKQSAILSVSLFAFHRTNNLIKTTRKE